MLKKIKVGVIGVGNCFAGLVQGIEYYKRLQPTRHPPASRAPNIEKIILAGGSAALPHLPEYLAENLEKPVAIGDPWVKINIDILKKKEYFEKALEVNPVFYSTVIGSALRGLSKDPAKEGINLLPKRSNR